jgi:hypothetical protein
MQHGYGLKDVESVERGSAAPLRTRRPKAQLNFWTKVESRAGSLCWDDGRYTGASAGQPLGRTYKPWG